MVALHHLALRTRNLDALAAFYRDWFGFQVVRDARPRSLWLGLEHGAVLMIEHAQEDEPAPDPRSLELLAFRSSLAERAGLRDRLLVEGMLEAETEHTLYFRDPDGRRVALSSYPL
jgi:catechol 2,3-dioxygenase-like lactoylglutathione lyase family enzyme